MKILKGICIRNDLFNPIIHIIYYPILLFPKQNADFSNSPPAFTENNSNKLKSKTKEIEMEKIVKNWSF